LGYPPLNSECRSAGSQPKYLDAFIEFVGWRILGSMENNAALIGVVTPRPFRAPTASIFSILKAASEPPHENTTRST
jgi:hypothetical protein